MASMNMKFARSFTWSLTSLLASLLVIAAVTASAPSVAAQELTATPEASADAEAPTDGEPEASAPGAESPEKTAADNTPVSEDASDGAALVNGAEASPEGETEVAAPVGISPLAVGALLIGLFVLPVLIGNWLAKSVAMPDHGWKISVILVTLAAAGVILYFGQVKFGPDLAGGITLIYELADGAVVQEIEEGEEGDDQAQGGQKGKKGGRELISRLTEALKQRVDPTGTKEVTIRPYGSAIEIIIPRTGQDDLEFIKRRITSLGQLVFRITVDPAWGERDQNIAEHALTLPPEQKIVELNGEVVAQWVGYKVEEFGPVDVQEPGRRIVKRLAGDHPEALVLMDAYNVTGEYLERVHKDVDSRGGPAVAFTFDSRGSRRFGRLTGENKPNPATGAQRNLGVVLDNKLLSAPNIREKITGSGQISGNMTDEEVEFILSVLDAGSLPAALNPEPLSEEIISSTLGAETIEKGKYAITVSLGAVLVFMLLYYRFAGLVACLALVTNLLLVLAVMVLIEAAFTLPGLAGLVLTVGMSVDANVLIFERIREEMSRGAGLRGAIRNGFGRATVTIVDANLTTLITGIVLYAIGTDQIKGFAVTLILGILVSMYTAIFCSRVIFDIAERRRWITKLSMAHIIGETHFDFIGKRHVAWAFSAIIIATGLVATFQRGIGILDIDFTGGTSVTMVLTDDHKMNVGEVRNELVDSELADKNLLVVERGETNTRFTVNSSMDSVVDVEHILQEAFEGRLKTYSVDLGELSEAEVAGVPGTQAILSVNAAAGSEESGVSYDSLLTRLTDALAATGHAGVEPIMTAPGFTTGGAGQFEEWTVKLGLDADATRGVLDSLVSSMTSQPMFPLANKIGGKVAGNMKVTAMYAVLVSLLGIIGYLWLRFQKVTFGLAAVIALVHDVLVTLGMIAISYYVVNNIPALAEALQIDSFQIGLSIVAAFMTIIGYSLNDTIVIFDRIREVRGKSPQLTADMINTSINQTLSRTLLTSATTLIVVSILYVAGGAGIHGFAFALVIGVIAGTYSTVFVATPALLAMSGTESATKKQAS